MAVTLTNWRVDQKIDSLVSDKALGSYAASQMRLGMDAYVPYEHGDLSGDAVITPFAVTYTQPYAHYQWEDARDMNYSHEQHGLATGHWEKAYASAHGEALAQSITTYLKGK